MIWLRAGNKQPQAYAPKDEPLSDQKDEVGIRAPQRFGDNRAQTAEQASATV